jgi:NAD(P)-dependent dehydrogenase (short-subunit alcohol dehydrogenase family)
VPPAHASGGGSPAGGLQRWGGLRSWHRNRGAARLPLAAHWGALTRPTEPSCIDPGVYLLAGLPEEKLFTEVVDIRQEEACAAFLEDVVARHGRKIDHAVSVFGHFWQGGERIDFGSQPMVDEDC